MSLPFRQVFAIKRLLGLRARHAQWTMTTSFGLKSINSEISSLMRNGLVEEARKLFDEMPQRSTVTYNAMIRGYFLNGLSAKAASLYDQMLDRDTFSYNTMISGLMQHGDVKGAEEVFKMSMRCRDVVTWNSMISGYVDNDLVGNAVKVFDAMPVRDVVSWNLVIAGLVKVGELEKAAEFFREMDMRDAASGTIMMKAFLGAGRVFDAREVFDAMPVRDVQAWNTIISGYVEEEDLEIAEGLFHKMPEKDSNSWSVMVDGFLRSRRMSDAMRLFTEMPQQCEKLWNSIMHGYVKNGLVREAHLVSEKSPFSCTVSSTNLMIGYFRMGEVEDAMKVFHLMPARDTPLWNAAIFGLCENDLVEDGVTLFMHMKGVGLPLDEATFTSFLTICLNLPSLNLGKQIHAEAGKVGIDRFVSVGNAFVTMYFRCGSIDDALLIFDAMDCRDIISWNSIISGLAHHGRGENAVDMFEKMRSLSVEPNEVTFVGVLSACSHTGLVERGKHYFNLMRNEYRLPLRNEHYTCIVDLLGRFGLTGEAYDLLSRMSADGVEVHPSVWGALLGACRMHKNYTVAEIAGEKILELEPSNSGMYMILSEIYLGSGRRGRAYDTWARMKATGVKKQPGCSWIESSVGGNVFLSGDRTHPEFKTISHALELIYQEMDFRNPDIGLRVMQIYEMIEEGYS